MASVPYILKFDQFGSASEGFITTTQYADRLPFAVRRVFWTYDTPIDALRGNHANKTTEEVLVAVTGSVTIEAETSRGKNTFTLSSPNTGLYIPALCWTQITFSPDAVAICLASTDFDPQDYVHSYEEFKQLTAPR
ncbi:WxcM-like domain-containing protein [Pontibacter qinzhouensis]|uniref:WxcM-like domain-containing protein n=1 Tax=Pontibacter qinzhouensis TaxID=2603253 RepID=A0A5C8K8T2_9BACT|nr:FdtA/QdtA family cupin domain-containing protein [Pontibacter qinzhouensis]TXK47125.1 WxcM-like domain-containing protein [Pontibacter qinzhouensis]